MFEAALQQLVEEVGAELAIFCDYEGESIAWVAPGRDPFEVRVIGAHHAALVLRLQRIARDSGQGERLSLVAAATRRVLLLEALPGGYYLLVELPATRPWATARPALARVAARFAREL